jgi:hypothetical protein
MLHKILIFTSFLISVPAVLNLINTKDKIETFLDSLIIITSLISILFWSNPIRGSIRHKFDGFFAKLSIIVTCLFVMLYQNNDYLDKLAFMLALMMIFNLSILSNCFSRNRWISRNHIVCHIFFHIIIIVSLTEIL